MKLLMAPMQGFTDVNFRNAWHQHFEGIDEDYAPYITLQNDGSIKNSQQRDILPDRNDILPVPQILPSSVEEALLLTDAIAALGTYEHININMGCPYPMVTNRGRGCGLLPQPQLVGDILRELNAKYAQQFQFSVKMRCGLEDTQDMEPILAELNNHALSHVILHPRVGKQLYKGQVSKTDFAQASTLLTHPLIYNGDITSLDEYDELVSQFPDLSGLMLGRGLLQNPLLAEEVKSGKMMSFAERIPEFIAFHDTLFANNAQSLSGDSHLLSKMKSYLPYFAYFNIDNKKAFKKLKKAQSIRSYQERMGELFKQI